MAESSDECPLECLSVAASPLKEGLKSSYFAHSLLRRVLQLERSIGSIMSKTEAMVCKLEGLERSKLKKKEPMSKLLDNMSKVGLFGPGCCDLSTLDLHLMPWVP